MPVRDKLQVSTRMPSLRYSHASCCYQLISHQRNVENNTEIVIRYTGMYLLMLGAVPASCGLENICLHVTTVYLTAVTQSLMIFMILRQRSFL